MKMISFFISLLIVAVYVLPAAEIPSLVDIPFQLKSGYVIFSIRSEDYEKLTLLFDTGCQTTSLGTDILKNKPEGGSFTLLLGKHKLRIDKYNIHSQDRISRKTGQEIHGVIGNDLLHGFQIKLDFKQFLLSVFDKREAISNPGGEDIEIEVNPLVSSLPLVLSFSGGPEIDGEFVIDTGAPITVLLSSPAAEKFGLDKKVQKTRNREFRTLAAIQTAAELVSESIRIGSFILEDVPLYISTTKTGLFAVTRYSGMVGTGLLRNFVVIFDYERGRLNLAKIGYPVK